MWGRYDALMNALLIGIGLAMWVTIIAICVLGKQSPGGCPSCKHDDGADSRGRCRNADAYCGWGSDVCGCDDDYHARQAAPTAAGMTAPGWDVHHQTNH